jgi:pyruvate dehydrogenase E1 component alpha subunit
VFLEAKTYRFRAHSMFDPDLYRPREEVETWKERDPITTLADRMVAAGQLDQPTIDRLWAEAAREVDDGVAFAEAGTLEPVEGLGDHVYRRERA